MIRKRKCTKLVRFEPLNKLFNFYATTIDNDNFEVTDRFSDFSTKDFSIEIFGKDFSTLKYA